MNMFSRVTLAAALVAALVATPSLAANYPIDWLDMSPTAFGSVVPNNSVINVAGIGPVTISYALPASWSHSRLQLASFVAGSVTLGPDTWQWSNYEYFSTISNEVDLGPTFGTITYTFPGTLPAGTVYVGALGLGATTSFGGGNSSTTVYVNGTYLGEFAGNAGFGPTQFNPGVGVFSMQNSLTGAGGQDPHWNTNLGVVRIDDVVSSITIHQGGLRGDGIGVNIGFVRDGVVSTESKSWGAVKSLFQ